MPGSGPEDVDEVVLGHFNAGFSPQDFTASLVFQASDALPLQAGDPGRECLRHRVRRRCTRRSRRSRRSAPDRARGRRRADDDDARARDRQEPPQSLLPAGGRRHARRASPASSARSPGIYFQRHGDQSDALAMIAAKNHKNGVGNPYAQMRKDLGFEFCRAESEKNPFVAGPAEAHRLLARLRRRRGPRDRRHRDGAAHEARGRLPRDGPRAGLPADVEARHRQVRGLRAGLAAGARTGRHHARRPLLRRDPRLLHHRRAHRIRGDGPHA